VSASTLRERIIAQLRLAAAEGRTYRAIQEWQPDLLPAGTPEGYASHSKALAECLGNAIYPEIGLLTVAWYHVIVDRFDPTPGLPSSAVEGEKYLSTATANGWIVDKIYLRVGASWTQIDPAVADLAFIVDENVYFVFKTTWTLVGAYAHSQAWSTITATPTTLAGYGITDAAASSHSHTFSSITSKPTTLSGYGITDGVTTSDGRLSDARPASDVSAWAKAATKPSYTYGEVGAAAASHNHAWGDITSGKPTTLSGYGITDGVTTSDGRLSDARPASDVYAWAKAGAKPSYTYGEVGAAAASHNHAWGDITSGKPTTLSGYGITDGVTTSDGRLSDARPASDVYAWAKAGTKPSYTYGEVGAAAASHNHAWGDITSGKPTTLSGYGITDGVTTSDGRLSDARTPTAHAASHFHNGSDSVEGVFNNFGEGHATFTDFNSVDHFGPAFVQGTTNGPGIPSATQYYQQSLGLGSEYAYSQYAMQMAVPRAPLGGTTYLSVRFRESTTWSAWSKIYAGYADVAGDVYSWAKAATKPSYSYSEVGADVAGASATVQGNLNTHAGLTTTAHGLGASAFHADNYFAAATHYHSSLMASDGAPNPALSVDADGFVGIGTASPGQALHVVGAGVFTSSSHSVNHGTTISNDGAYGLISHFGADASTLGSLRFYLAKSDGAGGVAGMIVNSTDVIIGRTTAIDATAKLSVQGRISAESLWMYSSGTTLRGYITENGANLLVFGTDGISFGTNSATPVVPLKIGTNGDVYTTEDTDYSGSTTLTGLGSSYLAKVIRYKVLGKTVKVDFSLATIYGSGSDVSFTLPLSAKRDTYFLCYQYGSGLSIGEALITSGTGTVTIGGSTWSGGTRVTRGQFEYEIS
jgi:hypothetical protein